MFLTDQVRRLTDELARAQSALGGSRSALDGSTPKPHSRSFLEVRETAAEPRSRTRQPAESYASESAPAWPVSLTTRRWNGGMQALPDGSSLPAWLSDSQYLSPLLLAYDERIADQEARLAAQLHGLTALSAKVETVVRENETLAGDLDHHMALLASKADTVSGGSVPEEAQVCPTHRGRHRSLA